MPNPKYTLHLKGYVGGWDFDSDYVDFILGKNSGKEVAVLIDSLGGQLNTALSISSAFRRHGNVHAHFVGMNASAATIASMGAKRITMDASAMYLVHQCSQAFFEWGSLNATDMQHLIDNLAKQKENLDKMDANVAAMYAARCKKEPKNLLALMQKGGWLSAKETRKAWDKSIEARCDFSRKVRLTRRGDVFFISLWQKSLFGRTLTDIKGDDSMVDFFADNIAPLINEILGYDLQGGQWCIVTTPKRRHLVKNFATRISERIAARLQIPFYEDVAFCHSKQRIGAVFTLNVLPKEPNCIVFDDFVTTGSTLKAMRNLLTEHHKNCVFFTGINNKL